MDPGLANAVIPPILTLFHLRRTAATIVADVNGVDERIGAKIPAGRWLTIELHQSRPEAKRYAAIHAPAAARLGGGTDPVTGEPLRNAEQHRLLCLAAANPCLDLVVAKKRSSAEEIRRKLMSHHDHGATRYSRLRPRNILYRQARMYAQYAV